MESNPLICKLKTGGNPVADSTLLFSDIFHFLPGSFEGVTSHFESRYRIALYEDDGLETDNCSRLRHHSIQDYAGDMIHCLQENKLRNITYVAHSVNALLAFAAALEAPYLFDKIILLNAFPSLHSDPQNQYPCGFAAGSASDLFSCLMLTHRSTTDEPAKQDIVQLTDILAKRFSRMDINAAQEIFRMLLAADYRDYLSSFQTPTLILQSAADKFSTSDTSFFMYRNLPDSRILKIKAKGHLPQIDAPEEIVKAIDFFTYIPVC